MALEKIDVSKISNDPPSICAAVIQELIPLINQLVDVCQGRYPEAAAQSAPVVVEAKAEVDPFEGLPARLRTALERVGIGSVDDLLGYDDLAGIKGIGPAFRAELEALVSEYKKEAE